MLPNLPEDILDRIKSLERRLQRTSTAATLTPLPPWQPLALSAGISTLTNPPQYRVQNSIAVLRGDVKNASGANLTENTLLATLPVAARPTRQDLHPVATGNTTASRVEVNADGTVRYHGPDTAWVGLNLLIPLG